MRRLLLLLLLVALAPGARGQTAAYGDWRLHLPARRPLQLAEAGRWVYVADESSFYRYDKELQATQLLSRRDGLSDVGVAALAYDSASAQLVIGYRNGNFDLLGDQGRVRNLTDLLRKESQTAKIIYQIQVYNGLAYVATNLGLLVLDLARGEVRDTYAAIGPGGQNVTAYAAAVVQDTLLAATSAGILRGRLAPGVNLLDFRAWTPERPVPANPGQLYTQLAVFRGRVVAGSSGRGVDVLGGVGAGRAWRLAANSSAPEINRLRPSGGWLLVAGSGAPLRRLDPRAGAALDVLPPAAVGQRVLDALRLRPDGTLLVASYDRGLLRFGPGATTGTPIQPNGPATAFARGLVADAATSSVVVLPGGYQSSSPGLGRFGFYEFQDGRWTNFTAENYPSPTDFPNPIDPTRGARLADGTLLVASYGNGLLQWRGPGQWRQYTFGTPGSPLRSALTPDQNFLGFVRLTDVAADPGGKFAWVVNLHQRAGVSGLFRLRPATGTWTVAPPYPGFDVLDRVVVDLTGNVWTSYSLRVSSNGASYSGLAAYDTTSQQFRAFGRAEGLPPAASNRVTVLCLARDRDGAIWAGTTAGVAVCSNPNPIAQAAFTTPIVPTNGNSGFPALFTESVTAIAVDGANRKWFGTPNGLWLFNPGATQALLHFTTANSPLPSNGVVDVAVNDRTGEVFVATDAGLVSYQGSASLTDGPVACAQAFPNPVPADFGGTVGIRGVANNAEVRITDVAGRLVYSTRAAGGTVTWNLQDPQGRRVASGVYLVLTADAEGRNTCVSKVAVLSR